MATMSIRLSDSDKLEADNLFKKLGITTNSAFNMFIKQCLRIQGLPFTPSLEVPNQRLLKALEESEDIINGKIKAKRYENFDAMLEDLD